MSAYTHQQSRPAPINFGDPLGPGNNKVQVGIPGYHSEVVSNQEIFYTPDKKDWIKQWEIQNDNYKFVGNIVTKTANNVTLTYQVYSKTIVKSAIYVYQGPIELTGVQALVKIGQTQWIGVLVHEPVMKVKVLIPATPIG